MTAGPGSAALRSSWVLPAVVLLATGGCRREAPRVAPAPEVLSVAEFGATPNDGENDAPALRAALEACRRRGPTTLVFPPGRYDFRDEEAVRLMDEVMGGAFGINPEAAIFRPYFPYVRGLDFTGIEDLTVEAAGAELICDGWMEPLSLEKGRSKGPAPSRSTSTPRERTSPACTAAS